MDFIQYEGMDVDKIKFLIPFAKQKNIDLSLSFITFQDKYMVKSCLACDMILCGSANLESNRNLNLELTKLVVRCENSDLINYYGMFFDFFKQTKTYANAINQHIQSRDNLPILEQFTAPTIFQITSSQNIDGFYESAIGRFYFDKDNIDDIPLSIGSRVTLSNQIRDEENGTYIVKAVNGTRTILDKYLFFRLGGSAFKENILDVSNLSHIDGVQLNAIKATDPIYIEDIHQVGHIKTEKGSTFLVLQTSDVENPTYDSRYECYDEPLIKSRGLCESDYDASGQRLKNKKNYWDRRCERNDECPFYQANKNYQNYFGGCIDGYCQMPVGIKPVSYRLYDTKQKPMCYNCKDPLNPFCCDEQKNRKLYPSLKSPDYAFALDSHERMKQLGTKTNVKWYNQLH